MQPSTVRPFTLLCVLCAMLGGRELPAQGDRFRQEFPVRPIMLTETEGELGTEYNYFGETTSRGGSGSTRTKNNYFQEYLLVRTRGYIYHPRFIDFSVALKPGLSQQRLHQSNPVDGSRDSRDSDELLGYDVRLDILKENPVSGTVTSRREERILMGLFLDRYRVLTDSHSATVRYRARNLRMDLTGTHTETEDEGFNSSGSSTTDTVLFNLRHDQGNWMRTDLRYRLQQHEREFTSLTTQDEFTRRTDTTTQNLDLTNRINFDQQKKLTLTSTARVTDRDAREGGESWRSYYIEELLRYDASRLARPYLRASARRDEYTRGDVDTYRGEAGLDGNLYDSLSHHFDLSATRTEQTAFTEDRYGPTGRLTYRKLTGLGVLGAGYSRSIEQIERDNGSLSGIQAIFNERLVVSIINTAFLSQPNADPDSLRVNDADDTFLFREGLDYEVITSGSRVGIRVIPGGLLADGDSVLVDYDVLVDGDLSYIGDDEAIHVRHDFDRGIPGLSLYARQQKYRTHAQSSSSNVDGLENESRLVGLRQQWRDLAFTTEYETYDDDPGGYDRWLNQLEGNHSLSPRLRVGWSAGLSDTNYDTDEGREGDDRDQQAFASANINGTFARNGFWRLEGRYLDNTGRSDRLTQGIIARVGTQWRRLKLDAGARVETFEATDYDNERVQVFVGARLGLGRRFHGPARQ